MVDFYRDRDCEGVDEMGSFKEELREFGKVILAGIIYLLVGVIIVWLAGQCSKMSRESQEEPPSWGRGL